MDVVQPRAQSLLVVEFLERLKGRVVTAGCFIWGGRTGGREFSTVRRSEHTRRPPSYESGAKCVMSVAGFPVEPFGGLGAP